jgi:hypothetical protein
MGNACAKKSTAVEMSAAPSSGNENPLHEEEPGSGPEEVVIDVFINTDCANWKMLQRCFADEVTLDLTSLTGGEPEKLTPEAIADKWSALMPGFDATHHQIGNVVATKSGSTAHVFCYCTSGHYMEHPEGNILTQFGSYDFNLILGSDGCWKVSSMTFFFKYQTGNLKLTAAAAAKVAKAENDL